MQPPLTTRSTLLGTWSSSHNRNDRLDFFWSGDLAIWRYARRLGAARAAEARPLLRRADAIQVLLRHRVDHDPLLWNPPLIAIPTLSLSVHISQV